MSTVVPADAEAHRAELAKRQAAMDARRAAAARDAQRRIKTARQMNQARGKPGTVSLPCIFMNIQPPRAGAAATAAAGQGGASEKKAPPEVRGSQLWRWN